MLLIDLFSDYIRNKKDLREYIERRKTINERGEFNDAQLLKIQVNLERLKKENLDIYNKMYETLEEIYQKDEGNYIEYPLNFGYMILQMFKSQPLEDIYRQYKAVLKHKYQTIY